MSAIRNIIFDFGNVLYDIDFERMNQAFKALGVNNFEAYFGFHHAAPLFLDLEQGFITPQQFCNGFIELTGVHASDHAIMDAWKAILLGYRKESIAWLEQNRKNFQLYLYSNTNRIHYDHFIPQFEREVVDYRFESLFVKPYYSHRLGQRKPMPTSFQFIMVQEELRPEETLFVDDSEPNILAAASTGLQVMHLKKGMRVETHLEDFLSGK
jgi:putative hydrolase of the HAD superfamily